MSRSEHMAATVVSRLPLVRVLLQKFDWDGQGLIAGRSYAASAVNYCLSESGAVDPKLPCSFRIM